MSLNHLLHQVYYLFFPYLESGLIQDYGDTANAYILHALRQTEARGEGLLIGKFGTNELSAVIAYLHEHKKEPKVNLWDVYHLNKGKGSLHSLLDPLYTNAGMFPKTEAQARLLAERYLNDLPEIDILGSYQRRERLIRSLLHCRFVHLNGYYAPFLYDEPWSQWLEGKRVTVVSSFSASIRKQYEERRSLLFDNPKVLPEFHSLTTIDAVQSIGGENAEHYSSWCDALASMEAALDATDDYDVALIGCGAYGLPLAAHVKRRGKVAIHLGGWVQMLFGVYGNRWLNDQPEFARFINTHWIRPSDAERPRHAQQVENGCYW